MENPANVSSSEAKNLLERLVAIPSPSGREADAAAFLVDWMAGHGFEAFVDGVGNAVGRRGNGPRNILLLGHMDTFSGNWPVRREGDWLHGRGSVDAKGPLCAFASAAAMVDISPGWQVTVVGAVQEEAATSLGARYLLETVSRPECCLIGEPSNWDRITLGYRGRLRVQTHWSLPLAHSAGPTRSPAEQGIHVWNTITDYCKTFNAGRTATFSQLDPSLRHFATNDRGAYAGVEMTISFRLPPDLAPDTLAGTVLDLFGKAGLESVTSTWEEVNVTGIDSRPLADPLRVTLPQEDGDNTESQIVFSSGEPAYRSDKNTPLVRAFLSAIRERGGRPRFVVKSGTSDMNVVGPVWNVPIVAYGPGDSTLDHTPQERISLTEYQKSINVLTSALGALQGDDA